MVGVLVQRGGINLKRPILLDAVVDYGCDLIAVGIVGRFLLNHRRYCDDLAHTVAAFLLPFEHFRRHLVVEGLKQLVYRTGGRHTLVKLIGIREQEALKSACIALFHPFEEGIVKGRVRRRVHKLVIVAYSLCIELFEDIVHGIALGEGYLEGDHCTGAGLHFHDKCAVIVAGLKLVCAGVKLFIGI